MSNCSSCSSCGDSQQSTEIPAPITQSADRLASLIQQTSEYQEFVHLAQQIRSDPDIRRLSMELRRQKAISTDPHSPALEAIWQSMDNLPVMVAYRKAEAAVKDLFESVDRAVSLGAGVEFAPNAVKCGGG